MSVNCMKKKSIKIYKIICCSAFLGLIILTVGFSGCGGGEKTSVPVVPAVQTTGEGEVSIQLNWEQSGAVKYSAPSGVTTVSISVSASDMTTITKQFSATPGSAGSGSISSIPAGTGRTFSASGLNSSGTCLYNGSKSGVAITAGQTATVSITLSNPCNEFPENSNIVGHVINVQSQLPIQNANIAITSKDNSNFIPLSLKTDAKGIFYTSVPVGTYIAVATADGYKQNTASNVKIVEVKAGYTVLVDFALPPNDLTVPVGTVSGRVTDNVGNPLSGATITISGGSQTNGVFASSISAANGTYSINAIPIKDTKGTIISSFTLTASQAGYVPSTLSSVVVKENETTTNVDFVLNQSSSSGSVYFEDDFETDKGWTAKGFWNRISSPASIKNSAVPNYVTLAPGDNSNGYLPSPYKGSFAYWYGQNQSGNFIGTQKSGDALNSGGTSISPNDGSLTSPLIDLTKAGSAQLNFQTWFEIESQNPNEKGYDLMIIEISIDNGVSFTPFKKLNPYADPVEPNRYHIPYTSAGFNKAPIWIPIIIDLTPYAGKTIQLRFNFETVDELYNGFRGWFIDDLSVTSPTVSSKVIGGIKKTNNFKKGIPKR